jgi:hypothetical protein
MEDEIVKQQQLKDKLKVLISTMESTRRNRLGRYCDWGLTSKSLLENVFNLDDWCILQKDGKQFCFTIIHEDECKLYDCSCTKTLADPHIKVYYLSDLFTQMISVSHFQLYFSGNWRTPNLLSDIIDGLTVSSEILKLFDNEEVDTEYFYGLDPEHRNADNDEFEKEKSPDFQRIRNEFNSLICEYVRIAFTDPTSLPQFLLDPDEGPTIHLSELDAWLESE